MPRAAAKPSAPKREIVKPKSFQDIILQLSAYWSSKGCAISASAAPT